MKLRIIFAVLAIGFIVGCSSDKADKEYYALADSFDKEVDQLKEKYKTVTTDEEKAALRSDMPDFEGHANEIMRLIETNPNSNFVTDAWIRLYNFTWYNPASDLSEKALNKIVNNYVESDKLKNLNVFALCRDGNDDCDKLVEKIIELNPDREIKGAALLIKAKRVKGDNNKRLKIYKKIISDYSDISIYYTSQDVKTPLAELANNAISALTEFSVGSQIPDVTCADLDGNADRLSNYKGNVIVLDAWATWCGPCVKMIPHEVEMVHRLKDKPFKFISLSMDNSPEIVKAFIKKRPMPWIHWYSGPKGDLAKRLNITQYPTIIIIDKEGVIRYRFNGAISGDKFDEIIDDLVEEKSGSIG